MVRRIRMEAGRLVRKASSVQAQDDDGLVHGGGSGDKERILTILREASGFGLEAVNGTFCVFICSCGKLFPKGTAILSSILHAFFATSPIKRWGLFPLLWAGPMTLIFKTNRMQQK